MEDSHFPLKNKLEFVTSLTMYMNKYFLRQAFLETHKISFESAKSLTNYTLR